MRVKPNSILLPAVLLDSAALHIYNNNVGIFEGYKGYATTMQLFSHMHFYMKRKYLPHSKHMYVCVVRSCSTQIYKWLRICVVYTICMSSLCICACLRTKLTCVFRFSIWYVAVADLHLY